jgi:uncharacterized metal-binding protein YceD (DUF177 family)
MTRNQNAPADRPEFSRPVELARISGETAWTFSETADDAERRALAGLLGAQSISKLTFAGTLSPAGNGWRLDGRLGASVVQACVVTLAPVKTRIDVAVIRRFVPAAEIGDDDDDADPLSPVIDLGLVATEEVALALPAYPRAPGATLDSIGLGTRDGTANSGDDSAGDGAERPFAALSGLRDKLRGG